MDSGDKKAVGIILLVVIGFAAFSTSPLWLPIVGNWLNPLQVDEQVKLRVSFQDGLTDAVWSPAGASVIGFWTEAGVEKSNTFAETPDGTFTSTARILELSPVNLLIADSASGVWTRNVVVIVPNINTIGVDDPTAPGPTILVYPHSATTADDVALTMIDSAGSTVSNASTISTGEDTWTILFAVSDDKAWGNAYADPQARKTYEGGLFVVSADPTKFKCYDFHWKVTYGSLTYWVWDIGQITNDGDYAGDGTLTFSFRNDALVATAAAIDVNFYPEVEDSDADAANFGTSDVQAADACLNIEIA